MILLTLIQVGLLLSYLVRFGNELFLHRGTWESYFDIWVIFDFSPWSKFRYAYSMGQVQLFLLYFYNLYTRSEYQDYLDILESVVKASSPKVVRHYSRGSGGKALDLVHDLVYGYETEVECDAQAGEYS